MRKKFIIIIIIIFKEKCIFGVIKIKKRNNMPFRSDKTLLICTLQ